jgi:hypothetical protein
LETTAVLLDDALTEIGVAVPPLPSPIPVRDTVPDPHAVTLLGVLMAGALVTIGVSAMLVAFAPGTRAKVFDEARYCEVAEVVKVTEPAGATVPEKDPPVPVVTVPPVLSVITTPDRPAPAHPVRVPV